MTPFQNTFRKKNSSLVLLITLFILAAGLRAFHLDRGLGGNDENAMLLYFGYSPLHLIITNYWDANNHIFHTILVRLMGVWFGEENSIAIRFPTFLFGLASLWMVYQIALELFRSTLVARMALAIATLNPTHIHYSQTARGYSLIIFFSAAIILLSLKVLRSEISFGKGSLLAIYGFLSVYTIPTNIYFLIGLGAWIFVVQFAPDSQMRYFKNTEERKIKGFFFLKIALAIAVLSIAAYAPLLNQLVDTIKNHQIMNSEIQWNSVSVLIPAVLEKVFPNYLLLFLPVLVLGFFYTNSPNHSYRSITLVIFFLPFVFTWLSGMGGYPRNYLYNFPLLMVLISAGMKKTGDWCGQFFKIPKSARWISYGTCLVYCIFSANLLFNKYYPSLKISNGKEFRKNISQHTQTHDLIAVESSQNYIYSRKKVKENLINIINDNRLSGFQLITPSNFNLFDYSPPGRKNIFSVIKRFWSSKKFETFSLDKENKITRMTNPSYKTLITNNMDKPIQWKIFRGNGNLSKIKTTGIQDQIALKLESSPENEMLVVGSVPESVSILKPSMAILVWTTKMKTNEVIAEPNLAVDVNSSGGTKTIQINMGRINEGMNIYSSNSDGLLSKNNWFLRSSIGVIPPGNYSFSIWLLCNKNQTLIYDEFRLFIIELGDN